MAFIRKKKIKGYEYAYLVENIWKKRQGSRQKVKEFLGRIEKPLLKRNVDFCWEDSIINLSYREIASKLVEFELRKHENIEVEVDFKSCNVRCKGKKIALQMNEGFLCTYTLRNLINFKLRGDNAGYDLANALLEAGIKVPQDLFIKTFEKLS